MPFQRRTLSVFSILLVVAVVAGATWWRLAPEGDGESGPGEATALADSLGVDLGAAGAEFSTDLPQPVEAAEVVRDTLWVTVDAGARAAAFRQATVATQVDGVIQSVPVRENSRVGQGDPIVQIDTVELGLELARARAEMASARDQYETMLLFNDEETDPAVRQRRELAARSSSGLAQAEVSLRQAEMRMERATVRAPFEGRVADLQVVAGQHAGTGTELMTIVDIDPIKVEVSVLEAELGYLAPGREAQVTFAAFPGETFSGRIETLNPVVGEDRTGRVTIHLPNPDGRIKPGMYADVRIDARSFPDRILVPRSAVLERGTPRDRTIVFLYEGDEDQGLAKWQYVITGAESDELVEIIPTDETGELQPGQVVLTDGHHYLSHDTRVRIVENVVVEGGRPGA